MTCKKMKVNISFEVFVSTKKDIFKQIMEHIDTYQSSCENNIEPYEATDLEEAILAIDKPCEVKYIPADYDGRCENPCGYYSYTRDGKEVFRTKNL